MNYQEHQYLLAERGTLERFLEKTPARDVIDRIGFEARLEWVKKALEKAGRSARREPLRAQLTFRGPPVVESRGIFAEFSASVVDKFADTVAAFAASLANPLAPSGAISNRTQYQLLVTGTTVGSFGFELEEHCVDSPLDLGLPSPVEEAIDHVRILMQASIGTDDEALADAATGMDSRAVKYLFDFIDALANHDAVCALTFGQHSFRFQDTNEVRRSLKRLSQDNLHEQEQTFDGLFLGVLPQKREFEFRILPEEQIIRGKVNKVIVNPSDINQNLERPCQITVQMTRVGDARPRYSLLAFK